MELRNRIVGAMGTAALLLGMSFGVASADTDSIVTSVQVSCVTPATVELTGDGTFAPIADITLQDDTQTAPGAFNVTVNVGCYLGPWQVNADVTAFVASPLQFFSGTHFSLGDSTVNSYFLDGGPLAFTGPVANDAVFVPAPWLGGSGANAIFETQSNWITFWNPTDDFAAPFESTASYTGYLTDLPFLFSGNYQAILTVELTTD